MHKHFLRAALACAAISTATFAFASDREGRIIVKFRDTSLARTHPALALQSLAANATPVHALANGAHVLRVPSKDADATLARLAAHPDVQYALRDVLAQISIDDPLYESEIEWAPGESYSKHQADLYDPRGGVNAPGAWSQGATGAGLVVAVLDTGVVAHPDLDANIVEGHGYDFVSEAFRSGRETDGRAPGGWDPGDWTTTAPWLGQCAYRDSSWHGTHVAGTIAAVTNNARDIAGMAYDAKVLPVRVLGHCGGWLTDIADGITWASGGRVEGVPVNETPAEVLNLSLGASTPCPQYLQDAIDGAVARGSTVVVAAGNENRDVANSSPANCRNVITVGSNGLTGRRAHYSNHGLGVTISAPGGGRYTDDDPAKYTLWKPHGFIWSIGNSGKREPESPNVIGMAGTSMAAPHVAAIVAMMQGAAPTPHAPAKIASLLADTARLFPVATDRPLGAGIADAGLAVAAAIAGEAPARPAKQLYSGWAEAGAFAVPGQTRHFVIDVPANATRLTLRSYGGTGDSDLYLRIGDYATPATHDAKSVRPGNNGIVVIDAPAQGRWHVALHGAKAYNNVYVRALVE